jgi:hypothetical protein
MVFAVDLLVPRVWSHRTPASVGWLGLLHDRMIWAAVAFPSAVILRELLNDIY